MNIYSKIISLFVTVTAIVGFLIGTVQVADAKGIVAKIVNSPLSAAGTVSGAHTGINIYLQSAEAKGIEFFDPKVLGYGIPPGGRIEIEMGKGFVRDWDVALSQAAIMLVSGAPQQGLPGKAVGYTISEGKNENTFEIKAKTPIGLPAKKILSPAPGSKMDPIRNRGIKVFHVGFLKSAFLNKGDSGLITVRIIDGSNKVVSSGSATVKHLAAAVPQILPNNFPNKVRNHNWQRVKAGQILGKTKGTVPVTLMLYARADVAPKQMVKFKRGIVGAGVLSTPQLRSMGYKRPSAIARYNGGLILQDSNGDGKLDPKSDKIIGGVIAKAPKGAKGQELKTLVADGKLKLSVPTQAIVAKPGKRFGGAVMMLQFTAGSKAGMYRPTLALLRKPGDLSSGDGSKYTYTIIVE
jgi:hypothetical protein